MTRSFIPQAVLDLAHARATARAARDWATADRLREEIEGAGWRVVDAGTDFRLEPAHAPDVEVDGTPRYGRSEAVPSRLAEPSSCVASVILLATSEPDDLDRALAGLRATVPAGTEVIVVADAPDAAQEARLPAPTPAMGTGPTMAVEVVRTSARLGRAAAVNIGLRRARGEVVIVMGPGVEPTGDVVSPLLSALRPADVAIAGDVGLWSADLRRYSEAASGDAAAIDGELMAFRRSDAASRGPLDEAFRYQRHLGTWWSLVLRDEGVGSPPRRAIAIGDLPVRRHESSHAASLQEGEQERLAKRNFYRLLDRFRDRRDLAVRGPES